MKEKEMKVNPKQHKKKATIVKGVKIACGTVLTIASVGFGIVKNVIKKQYTAQTDFDIREK